MAPVIPAAAASTPAWIQLTPATSPPASYTAAMAYDPATSQLVLFGGLSSQEEPLADTWTWDGTTWIQQTPATTPPARSVAAMAYDPATSQLVLFGGGGQDGLLGDTWTWNGTTWTQQTPATSPPARAAPVMAYDPATSQLVMFGGSGQDGDGLLGDTWTWDGTTWIQQTPVTSPPARAAPVMAYDPATSQVVLFGGMILGGSSADTWTWNGTTWTQQTPAVSPSFRDTSSLAYDPATAQLVLFGGYHEGSPQDDTWSWDGSTWTQQAPTVSPPSRSGAAMAYDPATSQFILFGGAQFAQWQDDTWIYEAGRQAQSITFTSTAPSSASYTGANDQTYAATATATSGLPVTLSIDPASTSGCTISAGTVSYGGSAGTCVIDANQLGNSSYLPAAQVTQRFTISAAPLSITASSAAMTYGGTVPAITPSYSGFVGDDGPASLFVPPSCSTTATAASPAGTYPSACTGAADPNYTIGYVPGTVTVNRAVTTTTLTTYRDPSARPSPITLTAIVTPIASAQTPAGEVDFYTGNLAHRHRLLGTAFLTNSGTASFPATALTCGRYRLYAVYRGSANDRGSTSATIRNTRCGR